MSLLASVLVALALASCGQTSSSEPVLIPIPTHATFADASYQLGATTEASIQSGTDVLLPLLGSALPMTTVTVGQSNPSINITLSDTLSSEAYRLTVDEDGIHIVAGSVQGARYAIQTLRQLTDPKGGVRYAEISDSPRFSYRGIMLDVSRHMVSKGYILRLLDEMARLKLNVFHWHLVDGGGWRMQSEAYPELTRKAAFRTESDWDKWWGGMDRQFVDEGTPGAYGGYYTKDDIREVVAYATQLGINVIPEIEMPGHSNELFSAYPDLFCISQEPWMGYAMDITGCRFITQDIKEVLLGDAKTVSDVCIGQEGTFTFFERILDEVMELFPSKYIHIGGDEAAMNHWGDCVRCKGRMKQEGLKDLHELQSYMIRRIESYLTSHGRKLIGWDEILMGGLAPEATVMSWRGEAGGIEAAKAGHDVIMTPNSHFYLDYYQSSAPDQPRANSSFVPLEKVYSYNPLPTGLSPEEQKHILGVQANLWTEYANTEEEVDYMLFPRMLAVAEVAWSTQERRSWTDFRTRASVYTDALLARGVNAYTLNGVGIDIRPSEDRKAVSLTLSPERPDVEIRYTLDGSAPTSRSTLYSAPITTTDSASVCLNLYRQGKPLYREAKVIRFDRHLGMDATATYASPWNSRYPASGTRTLIDGQRGTPTYTDKLWQGFTQPLDVTIDLGKAKPIHHIYAQFMQEKEHWVFMPRYVEVWTSVDGKAWTTLGQRPTTTDDKNPRTLFETFHFYPSTTARYVRLYAEIGRSEGHFIFTDEIVIQ